MVIYIVILLRKVLKSNNMPGEAGIVTGSDCG